MKLYELTKDLQNIIDADYDEEVTADLLEGYMIAGEEQVLELLKAMKTLEALNVGYAYESGRLKDLENDNKKKIESIKKTIDNYLQTTKQDKMTTAIAKLSYRKSEAVKIVDEEKLEDMYKRKTISIAPDKTKIKADIKKGIIVEGAEIETRQHLQIK